MRIAPPLLLLLLVACAGRNGAFRDRGMEPGATTLTELDRTLAPRRYAVVIGVNDYDDPDLVDLLFAQADATSMAERLGQARGGFDEVIVLVGEASTTRTAVLDALRGLARRVRRNDTVVVYFSGHGTRVPDETTWRRFLMVRDTDPGDLERTALDLAELQRWFAGLPAARRALIVDACFSGDGKSVVRPAQIGAGRVIPEGSLTPGTGEMGAGEAHLMATTAGRPAREFDHLGHGVYTYYLLDAMSWGMKEADRDGDGVVTAYEAHDHARAAVIAATEGDQIPEAAFRVIGTADVVLAGDPDKRKQREDSLIYLYSMSRTVPSDARVVVDGRDRGALPGMVTVPSGRHQVEIVTEDGKRVSTGTVRLAQGKTYRADHVARMLGGPARTLAVRSGFVASPVLPPLQEAPLWGGELALTFRLAQKRPRGMFLELGGGGGAARLAEEVPRGGGWTTVGLGWQRDLMFLRVRLGGFAQGVMVAPTARPRTEEQLGWWLVGVGPTGSLGVTLGESWALTGTARLPIGVLDPSGDGVLVSPQPGLVVGLEAAL